MSVPPNTPPNASLSVNPNSGTAPLDVAADASASTDTDDHGIDNYKFDFGDGSAVVGPQPGATATHRYATAGTYTVKGRHGHLAQSLTHDAVAEPARLGPKPSLTVAPDSGLTPFRERRCGASTVSYTPTSPLQFTSATDDDPWAASEPTATQPTPRWGTYPSRYGPDTVASLAATPMSTAYGTS